jgi:hypothetical protein
MGWNSALPPPRYPAHIQNQLNEAARETRHERLARRLTASDVDAEQPRDRDIILRRLARQDILITIAALAAPASLVNSLAG